MMYRQFVLPLLAAALVLAPRAGGQQPGDDFGILKTPSSAAPVAQPTSGTASALPAGIEPVRQANHTNTAAPSPFPLPPNAGDWMICAAAYAGPEGAELARQVCEHLRNKHRLRAYIFNRGAEERRLQEEEWQRQKQANPGVPIRRKTVRIQDHYAVLVAGWSDFKSASDALSGIKKLPCPELHLSSGASPYEIVSYEEMDPNTKQQVRKSARLSPFENAMVTRNPMTPNTAPAKPKFDPIWNQLNEDEEFSLLKNRGKWTLMVKEYSGLRELQSKSTASKLFSAIGLGNEGAMLDAAGQQAHELAKFLKQTTGLKTFVLHMRSSSVVTVGEYSSPDDPEMQRAQRQLGSLRFQGAQGANDPIGLMPNPLPVEVPRK